MLWETDGELEVAVFVGKCVSVQDYRFKAA